MSANEMILRPNNPCGRGYSLDAAAYRSQRDDARETVRARDNDWQVSTVGVNCWMLIRQQLTIVIHSIVTEIISRRSNCEMLRDRRD